MRREFVSKLMRGALGGLIVVAIAGCAQSQPRESTDNKARQPVYREHGDPQVAPTGSPAAPSNQPNAPEQLLQRMGEDLATRLGVKVSQIQVLVVEPVTWSDGSLGCPQPDRAYTAALTPGLRALFQHAGKTYQYHASERGQFLYCPNPQEPAGKFDTH